MNEDRLAEDRNASLADDGRGDGHEPCDHRDSEGAPLTTCGSLQSRLKSLLEELKANRNAIVLVTDLEALHPYLRIGTIESQLAGSFHVPTVFLYPGERTGKTRLKFLGFYPEDGNYRSVHVGG